MATIRFPSPSRYKSADDFFAGVYKWMTKLVGTELYRHFKTGEVIPDADELVEWLDQQAWPKINKYVAGYDSKATRGEWSGEDYQRQLERAVEFCLDGYDPEKIYNRARKGGMVGAGRKPTFPLAAFRALPEGLTVAEQVAAMGCSTSKIYELRRDNRTYDPALAGEFDTIPSEPAHSNTSHALLDLDPHAESAKS